MFKERYNRLKAVTKALSIGRLMGDNTYVYLDRIKTAVAKDRVAISFISDQAIATNGVFTNTVVQVIDKNNSERELNLLKSTGVLSYEAAMALIYKLRIDGYIVTDIANICNGEGAEFVSIEELNSDSDIIKISVSDKILPLVDTLMEKSEFRLNERHTSRIITLNVDGENTEFIRGVIELAFNKAFTIENRYSINTEDGIEYKILYGREMASIIYRNTITMVSTSSRIDCNLLSESIKKILDRNNSSYSLNITDELIMF